MADAGLPRILWRNKHWRCEYQQVSDAEHRLTLYANDHAMLQHRCTSAADCQQRAKAFRVLVEACEQK